MTLLAFRGYEEYNLIAEPPESTAMFRLSELTPPTGSRSAEVARTTRTEAPEEREVPIPVLALLHTTGW